MNALDSRQCAKLRRYDWFLSCLSPSTIVETTRGGATSFMEWPSKTAKDPTRTQKVLEQLTLLAAIARVDLLAWRDQVVGFWEDLKDEANDALRNKRHFAVGLEIRAPNTATLHDFVTTTRSSSPQYAATMRVIEKCLGPTSDLSVLHVPVQFVLDYEWSPNLCLTRELRAILAAVETTKTRDAADDPRSPRFSVGEVVINHNFGVTATNEALEIMKKLLACGVRVRVLPIINSNDQLYLCETIQELIPFRGSPSTFPGVSAVVLSDEASHESFSATLSALALSTSVRRVDLEYSEYSTGEKRDEFWRWVAYALFSRDAKHDIRHFHFEPRSLCKESMQIMRQVIEADDPLVAMMREERDQHTGNAWLTASCFFFAATSGELHPNDAPDFTSAEPLLVPTIKKTDAGWSVLLPGHGRAWVRDQDIHALGNAPVEDAPARTHQWHVNCEVIPTASLDGDECVDAMISLFSMIGDRVESLQVECTSIHGAAFGGEPHVWLKTILLSCPQLKELAVGCVGILDPGIFADTRGMPRLRKLSCELEVMDEEQHSDMDYFFEALSDASHPLTKSLQVLEMSVEISEATCDIFLDAMREFMSRNNRVHTVIAHIQSEYPLAEVEEAFDEFENELMRCTVPLQDDAKVAFLSTLPHSQPSERLDSNAIAAIFDFAAETRPRRFSVHLY